MDRQEHLNKIKAKCLANIAVAEAAKITNVETMMHHVSINIGDWVPVKTPEIAAYIAACAGPAEAGWRSTIAAVEAAESLGNTAWGVGLGAAIISAWPEELL